jgi:hypothetical protein
MSEVAEAIEEFAEATPRVVADLDSVDFEIEFMRDDVKDQYSTADLDEAYQLVMAAQVSSDDFKELIGEAELNAQSLIFESIIVFILPSERYRAVFASFDYKDDFPVAQLVQQVTDVNTGE